jgi:hypothetical protein
VTIDSTTAHYSPREPFDRVESVRSDVGQRSYLGEAAQTASNLLLDCVGCPDASVDTRQEIEGYICGLAKTVPLFMRRFGMAGTVAAYALDEMKPHAPLEQQLTDLGLGSLKGAGCRLAMEGLGKLSASPGAKGALLGLANRTSNAFLTRENYLDEHKEFDFLKGIKKSAGEAANPLALVSDAAVYSISEFAAGRLNYAARGALYKSPALPLITGGVFGVSSGISSEITRQTKDWDMLSVPSLDLISVLRHGAVQGTLDALASSVGAYQSYKAGQLKPGTLAQRLPSSQSEAALKLVESFNQLDASQLALRDAPFTITRKLKGNAYLASLSEGNVNRDVIFRTLDEHSADRYLAESFVYKLNRAAGLSNGRLALAERQAVIDGVSVNGYVQEMGTESFENGARKLSNGGTNRDIASMLQSNEPLRDSLKDAWVERMVMAEWDNHGHNIMLKLEPTGMTKTPNIDFGAALPEATFETHLAPDFGKTASRVSLLNRRLSCVLSGAPISEQTQAGLANFTAAFNSEPGRAELAKAGLTQAQMDGVLGRSHWLSTRGHLPRKEWFNPFTHGALWLLNSSGKGRDIRFEQFRTGS